MEVKHLQARVIALQESRTSTRVNHVIDRFDNVIKVVNTQAAESPSRSVSSRYSRINDVAPDSRFMER